MSSHSYTLKNPASDTGSVSGSYRGHSLSYSTRYSNKARTQSYAGAGSNLNTTVSTVKPEVTTTIEQKHWNPFTKLYRSLSWMFGFREKYSLACFVVFGGALLGFCLARAYLMNSTVRRAQTTPGEFRWFDLSLYGVNYAIHIYLSTIGGLLVGLQFLPDIRRRSVLLHRLNGYACVAILIPANVCGAIVARRSFGGEINAQSAYYISAIMLIFGLLMGYFNVKKSTRSHRKWMLRSVVYFSFVITARLIMLCARQIVTEIGTYYSLWRCDEVFYVLGNEQTLSQLYPQCSQASSNPSNNSLYVSVHASVHEGNLGTASAVRVVQGMTLWVALLIHIIGVEIYIRNTESLNYSRHGYVLERRDYDSESEFSSRSPYF